MFPIHDDTLLWLGILAGASGTAGLALWKGWSARGAAALLVLVGLWPVPLVVALGADPLLIQVGLIWAGLTLGTVLVGGLWGLGARRLGQARGIGLATSAALALLPPVAAGAILLERQRVPDAPCAEAVTVTLGEMALRVPRSVGLTSRPAEDAAPQGWAGRYGAGSRAKVHTRAMCRATDGGRIALDLGHAWLGLGRPVRALAASCAAGSAGTPGPEVCAASAAMRPTVVHLFARDDGQPEPTLSQFDGDMIRAALLAGQAEGADCRPGTGSTAELYCTVWMPLAPGVLAVATGWAGPGGDPLADMARLLPVLLDRLGPGEAPRQP